MSNDTLDAQVIDIMGWGEIEYARPTLNLSTTLGMLQSLTDWQGEPIWWTFSHLPGREPDEHYSVICEGVRNHVFGPTLPLAICNAIVLRDALSPAYITGVWYNEKLREMGYSDPLTDAIDRFMSSGDFPNFGKT